MNAIQQAIIAAHEADPEWVRAQEEAAARKRRIAGARMRREVREQRSKLDPDKVDRRDRFMAPVGRIRNPQAVNRE